MQESQTSLVLVVKNFIRSGLGIDCSNTLIAIENGSVSIDRIIHSGWIMRLSEVMPIKKNATVNRELIKRLFKTALVGKMKDKNLDDKTIDHIIKEVSTHAMEQIFSDLNLEENAQNIFSKLCRAYTQGNTSLGTTIKSISEENESQILTMCKVVGELEFIKERNWLVTEQMALTGNITIELVQFEKNVIEDLEQAIIEKNNGGVKRNFARVFVETLN